MIVDWHPAAESRASSGRASVLASKRGVFGEGMVNSLRFRWATNKELFSLSLSAAAARGPVRARDTPIRLQFSASHGRAITVPIHL